MVSGMEGQNGRERRSTDRNLPFAYPHVLSAARVRENWFLSLYAQTGYHAHNQFPDVPNQIQCYYFLLAYAS